MDRICKAIVKNRVIIMCLFAVMTIACTVLSFFPSINYNLVDYLPEAAQSTKALDEMQKNFTQAIPNTNVMVKNIGIAEALAYKEKIMAVDGVSGILWLDDVTNVKVPVEVIDKTFLNSYYKNNVALFSVTIDEGKEVDAIEEIYKIIGENNCVSGTAVSTAVARTGTSEEAIKAFALIVPVAFIILLLATDNWIAPLLLGGTIGVAVILNMGVSTLIGDVSFITSSISPILQLAVSLDYAIFLLHSFNKFKELGLDDEPAMVSAIKQSFSTIAASAATTLFGFVALVFMQFKIGPDLGLTLVRSILFSFISIIVFFPCLILCCRKLMIKTKHKKLIPEIKSFGKHALKVRIPVFVLILLITVPCYLAQNKNEFIYGSAEDMDSGSRVAEDSREVKESFGEPNPIVILVPDDYPNKEKLLSEELQQIRYVTSVISYSTMVDNSIPSEFLDESIDSQFHSGGYSRIIAYVNTAKEGDEAFAVIEEIQSTVNYYYPEGALSCGESANLYDMKKVVDADSRLVNAIAIIAIALILLLTFKSISLPFILLLTIESAVWINLSIPYFTDNPLCYIGYLVVSTVQLGATVDYAILLTSHYMENRKIMTEKDAAKKALNDSYESIFTSALTLMMASLSLGIVSSNSIVSDFSMLLFKGALLSTLAVVLFLPAALIISDRFIKRTTLKCNFFDERR